MKKSVYLLLLVLVSMIPFSAKSQMVDPVKWNIQLNQLSDTEVEVVFDATIDDEWHVYTNDLPEGGPVPTSVEWEKLNNVKLVGELTPHSTPVKEIDLVYNLELSWWENNAKLTQKLQIIDPKQGYDIEGYIRYMSCSNGTCLAPKNVSFDFVSGVAAQEEETQDTIAVVPLQSFNANSNSVVKDYWQPVKSVENQQTISSQSIWYLFIGGFLGGLLALLTPCVWPMIPLTVSFFLKKSGSRKKSIRDAIIYGISIIVIYLTLGIAITLIWGPSKLNELSTDAIFNIIFFLMLVVFAISFFGAFDLSLPSSWTSKIDSKADRASGLLSIFFMAFTLTLVSFSCTGPIIGTLLVEAVSVGDLTGPIIGMGAFALALAIPFTLFAVFPSWLNGLPKSGGWLNSVKVVLGFVELALSLKFLSVADLAYGWRILDREVFVSLWIVMFVLLGVYLLGKIRFPHDSKTEKIGVFRFFLAMISLSFAVYLLPGLWGAPLRSVSAFVPPLSTQDFNLYKSVELVEYDDFDEGMMVAQRENKPVFIDFSGYGCVNCRKMEAAVIDKEKIRTYLSDNFVAIKLMVDNKKELKEEMVVEENGNNVKLKTYGDLWSYLQRYKFGANSQPYYAILDTDGNLISGPVYYDENVDKFYRFLSTGVENFKNLK